MANFPPKPSSSLPLPLAILAFALFFLPASHSLSNNVQWPPVPLGPKDGKSGNLGDWTQWTTVKYMVTDQCFQQPGGDKVPDSYRLLFHCNNGEECVGAKYFVCYPSMLDPEALPDESNTSGNAPMRRALSQKWLTNSADNEESKKIAETCEKLVGQCKADRGVDGCWKEVPEMAKDGVEVWHGFSVTREKDKFLVKMPFGEDGQIFTVPDKDKDENPNWDDGENPPHFYINFGDANDAEKSYVSKGNISRNTKGEITKIHEIKDQTNEALYNMYQTYRAQGIPLDKVAHLWTLGVDILRDEEQQKIRFITKGEKGIESGNEECQMNGKETGLVKSEQSINYKYIVATYLKPNTKNTVIQVGKDANRIDVSQEPNKIFIVELKDTFTAFFFHIYIQPKAKAFKIAFVKGREEPDYLGEVIFEMSVDSLDSNHSEEINCYLLVSGISTRCGDARRNFTHAGESFWFFMDTKIWNVSVNCTVLSIPKKEKIPYSEKSFFKFEGDIELYKIVDDKTAVLQSSWIDRSEVSNILTDRDITTELYDGDFLSILFDLGDNFEQIRIKLVEQKPAEKGQYDEKLILTFLIAKNCSTEKCISICNNGANSKCEELSLIISHRQRKEAIDIMLFVNGKYGKHIENKKLDYKQEHFIQVQGDIKIPKERSAKEPFELFSFEDLKEHPKSELTKWYKTPTEKMDKRDYVIVHCLALEYSAHNDPTFTIKFNCNSQCKKIRPSLELKFDFNEKKIYATSNEETNVIATNVSSDFPLVLGKHFWMKMSVDAENNYNINFDGNETSAIILPCYKDNLDVNDMALLGKDGLLLNSVYPFPLRLELKEDFAYFSINVQVKRMTNAKFFEMVLLNNNGHSVNYMKVGTREHTKFKIDGGTILMHVWAKFSTGKTNDQICFSTNTIMKPEREICEGGNMFGEIKLPSEFGVAVITEKKEEIKITFKWGEKNIEQTIPMVAGNNAFKATHFVIYGDVALKEKPEPIYKRKN